MPARTKSSADSSAHLGFEARAEVGMQSKEVPGLRPPFVCKLFPRPPRPALLQHADSRLPLVRRVRELPRQIPQSSYRNSKSALGGMMKQTIQTSLPFLDSQDELLDLETASERLGISTATARNWVKSGVLTV